MTLFLTLKLSLAEITKVGPSIFLILWLHSLSTVILESPKIKSVTVMKLRHLLLVKKAMTNLDSILKSRDFTFLTKVHIFKAVVFLVVMYKCKSWTIKKAEHQRIDGFELWHWRRLLRVPLDSKEIIPVNPK